MLHGNQLTGLPTGSSINEVSQTSPTWNRSLACSSRLFLLLNGLRTAPNGLCGLFEDALILFVNLLMSIHIIHCSTFKCTICVLAGQIVHRTKTFVTLNDSPHIQLACLVGASPKILMICAYLQSNKLWLQMSKPAFFTGAMHHTNCDVNASSMLHIVLCMLFVPNKCALFMLSLITSSDIFWSLLFSVRVNEVDRNEVNRV